MRKLFERIYDFLTGRCIRKIAFSGAPENSVYLTFDDGPSAVCTPLVLDLLLHHKVKATFFLIGQKAISQEPLTRRILAEGHTIGNHSIDHDTRQFFGTQESMKQWLSVSHNIFSQVLKINSIGFRSPLGMKTPPMNSVLKYVKWPLILWDVRFYDTKYGLSKKVVKEKLSTISDGSIILLHDTHVGAKQAEFLSALEYLIIETKKKNLKFLPLEESLVMNSYLEKYKSF